MRAHSSWCRLQARDCTPLSNLRKAALLFIRCIPLSIISVTSPEVMRWCWDETEQVASVWLPTTVSLPQCGLMRSFQMQWSRLMGGSYNDNITMCAPYLVDAVIIIVLLSRLVCLFPLGVLFELPRTPHHVTRHVTQAQTQTGHAQTVTVTRHTRSQSHTSS